MSQINMLRALSNLIPFLLTAATMAGEGERKRGVILFVGDGMGVSTVTAARILDGQNKGLAGEENLLAFEHFPHLALVKTYNVDAQVSDSAGTMTALVTGHRTRAGVLSVGPEAARGDCTTSKQHELVTLLEEAEQRGYRTGVVSTARITHATPAATYAHSPDRNWELPGSVPDLPFVDRLVRGEQPEHIPQRVRHVPPEPVACPVQRLEPQDHDPVRVSGLGTRPCRQEERAQEGKHPQPGDSDA